MCDLCVELVWEFHVANNTDMYVANDYIFVLAITLLLLTVCPNIVTANVSWNATFATYVIFGQISTGPVDIFFLNLQPIESYSFPYDFSNSCN